MANPGNFQLFVYGSLLSGFKSPAYDYVSRYFDLVCTGRVNGLLFDMGEYPAAVPAGPESFIDGELYRIRDEKDFSWAMAQLDDYEGILVEVNEPSLYRREPVPVSTGSGDQTAWIYWYNGDVSGRPQIGSGNLLEYIASRKS
ncbi:MAG: gamma-glutamylcyclotransferase family protein [Chitinophagaceae bacterium]